MTGSWGKAWLIRSPSTGTSRAGGAPRRSGWEEAEEESPSGPVEGLRMGQTRSMCTSCRDAAAGPDCSGVRRGSGRRVADPLGELGRGERRGTTS